MSKFKQHILNDDSFAKNTRDLGNVYGKQWRDWVDKEGNHFDQYKPLLNKLKIVKFSPTYCLDMESATEIDNMALPPCHTMFNFMFKMAD